MPNPTPSGMEWQTWKNSTLKGPIWTVSPAWTVFSCTSLSKPAARKLDFQQAAGQRGGIDGYVDLLQQVVDGAGMVLMPVGDDNPAHFLAVCPADTGNRG